MKVILMSPPFENASKRANSYPLGLCYLGGVLEKEGHNVKAYNYLWEDWSKIKDKVKEVIIKEEPEVIGVSVMSTNRVSAFELSKLIKEINPKIKVVFGGVHSTMMCHQILSNFPVDFIVIGEGEITFPKLLDAIKNKTSFREISGIVFTYKNLVIKTPPKEFIKNLDDIPFPKHKYFSDQIERDGVAYMMTSRGCPVKCNFCNTTVHWGCIRRTRSVENVVKELKLIKKRFVNVKHIYFLDDEFLMNSSWVIQFCKEYIKENINLDFECVGRVSSANEDTIKMLKKAGCVKVDFGIESGSPKIIKNINKKITNEQVINAFNLCEKYELRAGAFIMVGLPEETGETINETINLMKQIPNAEMSIPAIFQLYPGTPIYEDAKSKGFIADDYWLSDKPAPLYTLEHSKRKLTYWALKIALYHKYYRGELFKFLYNYIKRLKLDKIKRIIKMYIK